LHRASLPGGIKMNSVVEAFDRQGWPYDLTALVVTKRPEVVR
jgi:hypothetical protein